jgi:hypothetical protein
MSTKAKKCWVVIVFMGALVLILLPRESPSSKAASHQIQMIDEMLSSNGFVRHGNGWELPDRKATNVSGTNLISN